jgi:hypothetical protein
MQNDDGASLRRETMMMEERPEVALARRESDLPLLLNVLTRASPSETHNYGNPRHFRLIYHVYAKKKKEKKKKKKERRKMWHTTNYCTLLTTNKNTTMLQ